MEIKILDFTAKWCSTCKVLDKIMETDIIPRYQGKVQFIKADAEEDEELTNQYDILSVPTIIILKDGNEAWRKTGSIAKDEIISRINGLLSF